MSFSTVYEPCPWFLDYLLIHKFFRFTSGIHFIFMFFLLIFAETNSFGQTNSLDKVCRIHCLYRTFQPCFGHHPGKYEKPGVPINFYFFILSLRKFGKPWKLREFECLSMWNILVFVLKPLMWCNVQISHVKYKNLQKSFLINVLQKLAGFFV